MDMPAKIEYTVADTINAIPRDEWDSAFPEYVIEGWGYHKAIEESGIKEFKLGYILAKEGNKIVGILPFFTCDFSFTTIIQGPLQKVISRVQKFIPRFMRANLLFLGLPTAEEFYIGISAQADAGQVTEGLLNKAGELARQNKIKVILLYNLSPRHAQLARHLGRKGFSRMVNYPNTAIAINAGSLEEYLKGLSKNTRKDIRRKLRPHPEAAGLSIEMLAELDDSQAQEIFNLYMSNFQDSDVRFETLTPSFFQNICRFMPHSARIFLARARGKIVAFNLCLIKNDTCIDKFIGFDRRLARLIHLYHRTFCHNIDWCIKNGIKFYQMGITDYHPKIRLGAKLIPLDIYLKCPNPIVNFFARPITKLIQPTNFDPTLKKIKK